MSALKTQVGGDHYKKLKIQPFEFCFVNKFNNGQSSVIRYVSRYNNKNGKQDLLKAIHVLHMMIELEYPESDDQIEIDFDK